MSTTKDAPDLQLDFVEIVEPRLWISSSYKDTYVAADPTAVFAVDNPGSGWFDCGTIRAARLPVTKDVFEHMQGVPKTSRKFWEVGRTAQITFNTADLSPYVEALLMGQTLYNTTAGSGTNVAASAANIGSLLADGTRRRKYIVTRDYMPTPALAEYDIVVCASNTNASLKDSYNIAVVESANATKVTLADSGFPVDPVLGDTFCHVKAVEFIDSMGSDQVRSALLFYDSVVSGGSVKIQYALYFPKIRNYAGGDFDLKDGAEPYDVGITFSSQAVNMTYGDGSTGYNFYKKWVLQF